MKGQLFRIRGAVYAKGFGGLVRWKVTGLSGFFNAET